MSAITQTQEVSIVNPGLLTQKFEQRKSRVTTASTFVAKLPEVINDDAEDQNVLSIINKLQTLGKSLNEERTPITKKFDEIRANFTADEKAVEEMVKTLSGRRNKYVEVKAAKIKAENDRKLAERYKGEELLELQKEVEIQIRYFVVNLIESKKNKVLAALKTVTSKNKVQMIDKLNEMSVELDPVFYGNFEPNVISKYGNDVNQINAELITKLESEMLTFYKKDLDTFKHECIMQVNSLAEMSADEKKEAIESKELEVKLEASTAVEVAKVELENQTDAAKAEMAFTSLSEGEDNGLPQNRQGFEIEVLNNAGWIAVATFWLTTLAESFTGNFETKTLKSMKTDLEKYAKDKGTKLVSKNVLYKEKFTAINKS